MRSIRQLAENVIVILPHNVRDMIYIYVWDTRTTKEAFYSIRTSDLAGRPWQKRCLQTPCNCFHCDELPLFIQHDLVGMDMAREVAAAYYRAMPPDRFKFDITSLRYYLMEDHFHLGVVPAEHIRRLRIIVSPIECAELAEEINEKIYISARGQELVDANLQELDVIRYKYGFRLTVVLGSGISGAWTDSTMEAFRDTYDMLTAAGVRFRVYGRSSKSHYPILRIERYFSLPREEWYRFVRGQAEDDGEFEAEYSDDEDDADRAFRYDIAA